MCCWRCIGDGEMMFYSDDPVRDAERYDRYLAKQEEELPQCHCCGDPIQDDFYYEINGDAICEDCLQENFRKKAEE